MGPRALEDPTNRGQRGLPGSSHQQGLGRKGQGVGQGSWPTAVMSTSLKTACLMVNHRGMAIIAWLSPFPGLSDNIRGMFLLFPIAVISSLTKGRVYSLGKKRFIIAHRSTLQSFTRGRRGSGNLKELVTSIVKSNSRSPVQERCHPQWAGLPTS